VNTDLPIYIDRAVDLAAHEGTSFYCKILESFLKKLEPDFLYRVENLKNLRFRKE
jgi:hypothetical protein